MSLFKNVVFWFILTVFCGCTSSNKDYKPTLHQPSYIFESVKKLTDIMVHDIFSPPVASRIYAYPIIAAYEIMQQGEDDYQSLAGQIKDLRPIPAWDSTSNVDLYVAAIDAYTKLGQQLIFSEQEMVDYRSSLHQEWADLGLPSSVLKASESYADLVVSHIIDWMSNDQYAETRTDPKFSVTDDPSRWVPTPPAYMDGIEPHWRNIRTMVLQRPDQFQPAPPPPFSIEADSDFYREAQTVMQDLTEEKIAIASFWDCNPFVMHQTGHVMFASKKISPGGHWIGITEIACKQQQTNIIETLSTYTMVSIGLFDAFISCWDEKYRSNLIRPETYINKYIDDQWQPVLQTPPFPEHTSGHSVVSRTSAIILTKIFGPDFAYNDTVEEEYGLPARQFDSFLLASEEAAISRLYGGIHYMPAIEEGIIQGQKVGEYIWQSISLKR